MPTNRSKNYQEYLESQTSRGRTGASRSRRQPNNPYRDYSDVQTTPRQIEELRAEERSLLQDMASITPKRPITRIPYVLFAVLLGQVCFWLAGYMPGHGGMKDRVTAALIAFLATLVVRVAALPLAGFVTEMRRFRRISPAQRQEYDHKLAALRITQDRIRQKEHDLWQIRSRFTKRCTNCHEAMPEAMHKGDHCPYCGSIWTYEGPV
jgi:hypothetical protein